MCTRVYVVAPCSQMSFDEQESFPLAPAIESVGHFLHASISNFVAMWDRKFNLSSIISIHSESEIEILSCDTFDLAMTLIDIRVTI